MPVDSAGPSIPSGWVVVGTRVALIWAGRTDPPSFWAAAFHWHWNGDASSRRDSSSCPRWLLGSLQKKGDLGVVNGGGVIREIFVQSYTPP